MKFSALSPGTNLPLDSPGSNMLRPLPEAGNHNQGRENPRQIFGATASAAAAQHSASVLLSLPFLLWSQRYLAGS